MPWLPQRAQESPGFPIPGCGAAWAPSPSRGSCCPGGAGRAREIPPTLWLPWQKQSLHFLQMLQKMKRVSLKSCELGTRSCRAQGISPAGAGCEQKPTRNTPNINIQHNHSPAWRGNPIYAISRGVSHPAGGNPKPFPVG